MMSESGLLLPLIILKMTPAPLVVTTALVLGL
jgi:hypothetical protein